MPFSLSTTLTLASLADAAHQPPVASLAAASLAAAAAAAAAAPIPLPPRPTPLRAA